MFLIVCQPLMAVDYLKKGQAAPNDGYLFNKEEESKLRVNNEKLKLLGEIDGLKDKKIDILQERTDNLEKYAKKSNDTSFLKVTGYFLLGVLVTGIAVQAANKSRN